MTDNATHPGLADETPETRQIGYVPAQSEEPPPPPLPPPPPMPARRRKLPMATLALGLAAALGGGFFAGVRVEKQQITPTASTARSAGTASGFGNAANLAGRNGGATASSSSAPGAAAGGAGSQPNGGGNANIIGTIAMVQGSTLYITETGGNTVKVTTSDGTAVTKTVTGTVKGLAPGESVVIRGVQSADGGYAAQSVTQGTAGAFAGGFGGGRAGTSRGARAGGATASPSAGSGN
jgi:hypothetical protein